MPFQTASLKLVASVAPFHVPRNLQIVALMKSFRLKNPNRAPKFYTTVYFARTLKFFKAYGTRWPQNFSERSTATCFPWYTLRKPLSLLILHLNLWAIRSLMSRDSHSSTPPPSRHRAHFMDFPPGRHSISPGLKIWHLVPQTVSQTFSKNFSRASNLRWEWPLDSRNSLPSHKAESLTSKHGPEGETIIRN